MFLLVGSLHYTFQNMRFRPNRLLVPVIDCYFPRSCNVGSLHFKGKRGRYCVSFILGFIVHV